MKAIKWLLSIPFCVSVLGQTVEIKPAVELVFPTEANKGFQIQKSDDFSQCRAFQEPVFGNAGVVHRFLPASDARQFFQLATHGVRDLNALLEPIRVANNVPALACAVVLSNRIVGLGAVGLRKAGVPAAPVTLQDKWHHGSLTKCSLLDLAKFVAFHVSGDQADTSLLKRDSFVKLHTALPDNANYAYGWIAVDRPRANGKALAHAGSNTQWYSVIWMAPNREFGVVALCNMATSSGVNPGAKADDQIVAMMIQQFLSN